MSVFFLTETLINTYKFLQILFPQDALVWDFVLFVLYMSKSKLILSMLWDVVSWASQYFVCVLEYFWGFILKNEATSTSLTSTSGGLSKGSTTAYKQSDKSDFVLHCHNYDYNDLDTPSICTGWSPAITVTWPGLRKSTTRFMIFMQCCIIAAELISKAVGAKWIRSWIINLV